MRGDTPVAARALLLAAALGACAGCNAILGPSAPDSNWRAHERARFTFYARPGSFGEQHVDAFAEVLEDQYDHSVRVLSLRYAGRLSIFLYDSAADAGRGSDRSGTAYPDTEAVKVVCTPPLDDNLYGLLAHEANHVILRNGLGRAGTSFVNEGLASAVLSERYHQLGRHFLYAWGRTGGTRIPPLSALADDDQWGGFDSNAAYNTSASFLAYLLETYGADRLRQVYPVLSRDFATRFSEVYGRSLEQAEAEWKRFCAEWAG